MLKQLIFVAVLIAGLESQNIPDWLETVLQHSIFNTLHGFTFQYDDAHDLIIVMGIDTCYLLDAPAATWDAIFDHHAGHGNVDQVTELIYNRIVDGSDLEYISATDAENEYHSSLESWECQNKDIYKLTHDHDHPVAGDQ